MKINDPTSLQDTRKLILVGLQARLDHLLQDGLIDEAAESVASAAVALTWKAHVRYTLEPDDDLDEVFADLSERYNERRRAERDDGGDPPF